MIFGVGNEITNSYLEPDAPMILDAIPIVLKPTIDIKTIKELSETIRKYAQDNRLASVSMSGSANRADYTLFTSINGVGNSIEGKGSDGSYEFNGKNDNVKFSKASDNKVSIFSAFNNIDGYENSAKNVFHTNIRGSWNELENALNTVVVGNNHMVKGEVNDLATGNIIIGFSDKKDVNRVKMSAKNVK